MPAATEKSPTENRNLAENRTPTENLFVWDLPLRLFHWGLVAAVISGVVSVNVGRMDIHERAGLTVLALVVFRIIWGFAGGHHARFVNFVRAPWTVLRWLRAPRPSVAPRQAGHSPLAALSVLALLAITGFLATTGMFSTDGILFDGPLAHLSPVSSDRVAKIHHLGKPFLILLVLLHLGAILVYKFAKKINLTQTMVTGRASDALGSVSGPDGGISRARLIFGLCLLTVLLAAAHALPLLRPAW